MLEVGGNRHEGSRNRYGLTPSAGKPWDDLPEGFHPHPVAFEVGMYQLGGHALFQSPRHPAGAGAKV